MRYDRRKDISPKYLLLAFTVICVVFLLISYFAGDQLKLVKDITGNLVTPVQQGINKIGIWTDSKVDNFKEIQALNEENEALKKEVAMYKAEITNYQNKLAELEELRALYELDESFPEYEKTGARVFAKDSSSFFSVFYIDKGSDDGIKEGMNVLCGEGIAGLVIECHDDYSKVRGIVDDNSSISAKVMPANALCTVEGNLSFYQEGYIIVKNIDKDAKVSIGDKVVTSPISDRYHQGIIIGYVAEISYDTNNLTMTAKLTPATDFTNVSEVLIILDEKENPLEN
ncbi:MAG: rod shape-determining protein MreC [Lachnospiraceae bacterium]|nr:rod shape-determining protein MreC [Lachnospiraceae bacterium]